MNNGDKIRSMTDDKLAKVLWLLKISDCGIESFDECKTCIINGLCQTCSRKAIKEWLKKSNSDYYKMSDTMQYTGLRDKNNKLVHFGDLVKLPTGLIGKVTQILDENSADYGKIIIKDIEKPHNVAAHWYTSSLSIKDSEIIGNIYENKE